MSAQYQFETLAVSGPDADGVVEVALNRPEKLNAMNNQFWHE
jgi:enoyl-CoA hydratase/carnithine racemase